jgi:hypothetical protein
MLSGEVKDSPLPLLRFIDLGSRAPKTVRVARINCRRFRMPLTGGSHRTDTAGCVRMRDHYDATTEGPRCPVMSAPTSPTTRVAAPPEKARPPHTTTATTMGI